MNNKLLLEPHSAPDIFWRSLQFFSLYRLAVSLMFFAAVIVSGDVLSVGIEDPTLFVRSAILYVIAAMAFLAAVRRKRNYFNLQLSVQVATDILLITLMMYASGGQKSGIGVLLMVVVAGAGLVGQGRLTLFYAALASLSILMEQSWRALVFNADAADFARSGFTCLGFFGTAITAQLLARLADKQPLRVCRCRRNLARRFGGKTHCSLHRRAVTVPQRRGLDPLGDSAPA